MHFLIAIKKITKFDTITDFDKLDRYGEPIGLNLITDPKALFILKESLFKNFQDFVPRAFFFFQYLFNPMTRIIGFNGEHAFWLIIWILYTMDVESGQNDNWRFLDQT